MWLVVSRPGKGRKPWYLLTSENIVTVDDAWRVVMAYARRWQVEMCYRACKSDLAMESPRLWFWENRLKLLLLVSLVYAFLPSLLVIASLLLPVMRLGERLPTALQPARPVAYPPLPLQERKYCGRGF